MTRLATAMASMVLFAGAGLAQVKEIRYPPLAAALWVQGDARLHSGPDGVVPISGPPLLVQAAMLNMKALGKLSELGETEVVFHYSLIEPSMRDVTVTIKKGDAFERVVLRLLGFKTGKMIKEAECVASPEVPDNRIDATRAPIEIWVYASARCATAD